MSGAAAVSAAKNRRGKQPGPGPAPPGQARPPQQQQQHQASPPNTGPGGTINPLQILHNHEMRLLASEKQQAELVDQIKELYENEALGQAGPIAAAQPVAGPNFMPIITAHETKLLDLATKVILIEKNPYNQLQTQTSLAEISARIQTLESRVELPTVAPVAAAPPTEETIEFYKTRTGQLETLVAELKETLFKLQTFAIETNTALSKFMAANAAASEPFDFKTQVMSQIAHMCASRQYEYDNEEDADEEGYAGRGEVVEIIQDDTFNAAGNCSEEAKIEEVEVELLE